MTLSTIAHGYVGATELDRLPRAHAVALAAASGAKLVSVHAATHADDDPAPGPPVAPRLAVREERLVHRCCDDPVDTVLDALGRVEPDLVVLGTEQRQGIFRVFAESRAEVITANLDVPVLIVPRDGAGFVGDDGALRLRRVVVPCGDGGSARAALDLALGLVDELAVADVTFVLVYVGAGEPPEVELPPHVAFEWTCLDGRVEEALAGAAADADLVVMATRGHDSIYDGLLGSHTERVLRLLRCPLLSVPVS